MGLLLVPGPIEVIRRAGFPEVPRECPPVNIVPPAAIARERVFYLFNDFGQCEVLLNLLPTAHQVVEFKIEISQYANR